MRVSKRGNSGLNENLAGNSQSSRLEVPTKVLSYKQANADNVPVPEVPSECQDWQAFPASGRWLS
jgi:hypothetical protein